MEMALQMPSNYVEVTEDEMMYVDGGACIPRWSVAVPLDIAALATPVGLALAPVKFLGKSAAKALVKKMAPKLAGLASTLARTVLGASINITTGTVLNMISRDLASFTSVGGVISYVLDYSDGSVNGKICF